jgi:site-specific DNA recombinase
MTSLAHIRFALYARVSTEAQEEDGQSLDTQLRMMQDAVRGLGGIVECDYRIQESAMPGSDRPSLGRLLKDAASGRFDAVMVCKLDRLARSIEVLSHVETSLRDFGIHLFEGSDQHNLRSAEGRLTRGMQALIGEYSVNRLKWSACASRLERAKRGWPHSGMLPWGRVIEKVKDRRNQDAAWSLDPAKAKLAQRMFEVYVERGVTLAELGRTVGMNPETVRRILMEQGGPLWRRDFVDPATGQMVKVETVIPPLFSGGQLRLLALRAKQNQTERAKWAGRVRNYPLSPYIRCANPECGWSNLSGHQTYGNRRADLRGSPAEPRWAYYLHLKRSRVESECLNSIPAGDIETEIFSRLGQLLASSDELGAAIRSALITDPDRVAALRQEQAELNRQAKSERRLLGNAMEVLIEQKGTAAAGFAEAKVRAQNQVIGQIENRLTEVEGLLKVVEVPKDFSERFTTALQRLTGLHGHVPNHWPLPAKQALLRIFFGGSKSTRFDRGGKGVRTDMRGIFVRKALDAEGKPYWTYEVRGIIGDLSGAITSVVALYDDHSSESLKRQFSRDELRELAGLTPQFEGLKGFGSFSAASRHWFASRCRGTFPRG